MKFYFCETCGVRLTDADLSDGLGRDKKLKGVFCKACAVGVTTMESMPLSEEKARQLLLAGEQKEKAAGSGEAGATKFYFCEKCGERLNDADIEAGKARDKKLRGVYCLGCAEGVMTTEYEGMTREEAQRIVSKARQRRRSTGGVQLDPVAAARRKERRGSSRLKLKAAQAGGAGGRIAGPTGSSGATGFRVGAGIAVGVVAAMLLLFLFMGGKRPNTTRKKRDRKPVTASVEKGTPDSHVVETGPVPAETETVRTQPQAPTPPTVAKPLPAGTPNGPIVRYRFDEGSGAVVRDSSGRGQPHDLRIADLNNVTWSASGLTVQRPTRITSEAPAEKIVDLTLKSQAFSYEAVVTQNVKATRGYAVFMSLSKPYGHLQVSRDPRDLRFIGIIDKSVGKEMDGRLKHIVVSFGDGRGSIFVNGVRRGEADWRSSLSRPPDPIRLAIANRPDIQKPWCGTFRFVAIYDRALTEQEVAARHRKFLGDGGAASGLLVRYRFDEGSGVVVKDSSGRAQPLNLEISHPDHVTWSPSGLTINRSTVITSRNSAQAIAQSIVKSGAYAIELVVTQNPKGTSGFGQIVNGICDAVVAARSTSNLRVIGHIDRSVPNTFDGKTRHIVVSGGQRKSAVYVDGVRRAQGDWRYDLRAGDADTRLRLGNWDNLKRPWCGTYRFVAIYNRALSDQDVAARYQVLMGKEAPTVAQTPKAGADQATPAKDPPGLLVRYRFDEGAGAAVKDSSGHAQPLDLRIPDMNCVSWSPSGLTVHRPTVITSRSPAARVTRAFAKSRSFTIEARVTQNTQSSRGYGKMVSLDHMIGAIMLHSNPRHLRFIAGGKFDHTIANEMNEEPKHIAVCGEKDRGWIYVNGVKRIDAPWPTFGGLRFEDYTRHIRLANNEAANRHWCGTFHFVAVYDRAFTEQDAVARHRYFLQKEGKQAPPMPKVEARQPKNPAPARPPPGPGPTAIQKIRDEAYGLLDGLAAKLVSGSTKEALRQAEEQQKAWAAHEDQQHRKHAPLFAAVAELARQLQEREAVVRAALKERIGKEMVVLLKRGRQRGKLQKVDDAGLTLKCQSIINGKVVRTYPAELPWDKVSPRFLDGFAKKWSPTPPNGILMAILRIVSPAAKPDPKEADHAAGLLEKAKESALASYLQWRIKCVRNGELSVKGLEEWEALKAELEKRLTTEQASQLLKGRFSDFTERYGETSFYEQNKAAVDMDLERLRMASIKNILVNGDFETGKSGPWKWREWNNSGIVERPNAKPSNRYWFRGFTTVLSQKVRLEKGASYEFSAVLENVKGPPGDVFGLFAHLPGENPSTQGKRVQLGDGREMISMRFVAGGPEVNVGLRFHKTSACVDNALLVRVGKASEQ